MGTAHSISNNITFPAIEDRIYLVTRGFCIWLQSLFATAPAGEFRWRPEEDESEILIVEQEPTEAQRSNRRPIISVTRSAMTFSGSSVGQAYRQSVVSDATTFTDLIPGSITLRFIARTGPEAQALAVTVAMLLPVFRPSICRLCRLHQLGLNVTIGTESSYTQYVAGSSAPEWKVVPLYVPIVVQTVISTDGGNVSPFLRAVELNMETLSSTGEIADTSTEIVGL